MKNLAIIPARSGSKALPNKNIKSLHGKPLLAYSIDAAKETVPSIAIAITTATMRAISLFIIKSPFIIVSTYVLT